MPWKRARPITSSRFVSRDAAHVVRAAIQDFRREWLQVRARSITLAGCALDLCPCIYHVRPANIQRPKTYSTMRDLYGSVS